MALEAKSVSSYSIFNPYGVATILYKHTFVFIDLERRGGREGWKEEERKRERNINLLFHLHTHWLILVCALTLELTHNLGESRQCSNHLSYPGQHAC